MPATGRYVIRHTDSFDRPRDASAQVAALVKSLTAQFGAEAVHVNPWTVKDGEKQILATVVTFQSRNGNGKPAKVKAPVRYPQYSTPMDPEVWRKRLLKAEEAKHERVDWERRKMRDRITYLRTSTERPSWWEPYDWKYWLNRKRRKQRVGHMLARNWNQWVPGRSLYVELDAAFAGEKVRRASQVPGQYRTTGRTYPRCYGAIADAEGYKRYIVSLVGHYMPKPKEPSQVSASYSPLHLGGTREPIAQRLNIPVPAAVEPPFDPAEELAEIEYLQTCLALAEARKGGKTEETGRS